MQWRENKAVARTEAESKHRHFRQFAAALHNSASFVVGRLFIWIVPSPIGGALDGRIDLGRGQPMVFGNDFNG